jgi:SAM-dependent methyltransferase
LGQIERAPLPQGSDVVLHLLRAFRSIREILPIDDPVISIKLFNAFLAIAEEIQQGRIGEDPFLHSSTIRVALGLLQTSNFPVFLNAIGLSNISPAVLDLPIGAIPQLFLAPETKYSYVLNPSLFLRHASGQLFQEAHLILEQEARQQPLFAGFGAGKAPQGNLEQGVRFTPPTLARTLAEQALKSSGFDRPSISILDPACGSGVFLIEAIRELTAKHFKGRVVLRGFDISPVSCAMARFCLYHARTEAKAGGMNIDYEIIEQDSLRVDWGNPDIILMNPPFVPVDKLSEADRASVTATLGDLAKGRYDKAMAFVYKGARSLNPNGSLASVLPASILETSSGNSWREALAKQAELFLVGVFRGYGYFKASMVEPAFVILHHPAALHVSSSQRITVVLASGAKEDRALRELRLKSAPVASDPAGEWEVFDAAPSTFVPSSWLPRSSHYRRLIERFESSGVPRVESLFRVLQGALTGDNRAFVISRKNLSVLPKSERRFFRPAAGNSTIRDGRLQPLEYVFFPYDENGLSLSTEEELRDKVPTYFSLWINAKRRQLAERQGIDADKWWALTRHRDWQLSKRPKLVSTYFGDAGSFAYDDSGEYAVVQGHAWEWEKKLVENSSDEESGENESTLRDFFETILPFAYLSLLNSSVFERLLALACPRVQGGQFNLSPRFVKPIFIPDLSSDAVTGEVIQELARIGRGIHAGKVYDKDQQNQVAARAYGISLDEIMRNP